MIRFYIIIAAFITTIAFGSAVSFAQAPPGIGPTNPTGAGEMCNWGPYKESLFGTESASDGGYTAANGIGATGKYQFMPGTASMLETYKSARPDCKTMGTRNVGLAREACKDVQEAMMDEFTTKNLKWLKQHCPEAQAAVDSGKTLHGYTVKKGVKTMDAKACRASWSGILAAAHLAGANGACLVLKTGHDRDDAPDGGTGVSAMHYACVHKDLPVPGEDCTPVQYPGTSMPTVITPWEGDFTPPAETSVAKNSLGDVLKYVWVAGFQLMTNEITTTMMQQVQIIGTFFDAKHQLETQRLMQQKAAQASKDYHPSKQMCEIGTFVRNLANTEKRAELTQAAASREMLDRALMTGDVKSMEAGSDDDTRKKAFIEKFCSQQDNGGHNNALCDKDADPAQQNADINFTKTFDGPLTLKVNLLDDNTTPDEETLFAFLDNIFTNNTYPWMSKSKTILHSFIEPYQDMRSLVAMRSIAQNSFAYIISEKTEGPEDKEVTAAPFINALMKEMGIKDDEIEEMIGKNPSYYAQMEVLSKKIYQHPEFIANLYDKPANVKRLRAAMTAIKVMQDRDIHNAMMRREMLISMILELQLRQQQSELNTNIQGMLSKAPAKPSSTEEKAPNADKPFQ